MPCFRGIGLSIATDDNSIFPEFPHPDGSSAPFRNFFVNNNAGSPGGVDRQTNPIFLSPRSRLKPSAVTHHADPTVSVYIPSTPDANFSFHYTVTQPPPGAKYLYFKVAINGCYVVSWGVNPAKTATGTTRHALFAPSERYQHEDDDGELMTEYGIESRCFRFVSSAAGAAVSVADDGGLIEVRVLRARARRRRAAQPGQCRGGDRYGVANGLLDKPHDARYYDYHLIDPKDAPYASFRFHYRSWDNLRQLHLAPSKDVKASSELQLTVKTPRLGHLNKFEFEPEEDTLSERGEDECSSPPGRKSRLGEFQLPSGTTTFSVKPEVCRPLPDLPVTSIGKQVVQPVGIEGSEQEDGTSVASVSSSLCAYLNDEDRFADDTIELGSATELETIYCGTLSEKDSPDDSSRLLDVTVTSPCRLSPVEAQSPALVVFPFTDSLRKREVRTTPPNQRYVQQPGEQQWQGKPHLQGASFDLSLRSRGSPLPRRHGGSLDFDSPFLRNWDLSAASAALHNQTADEEDSDLDEIF